MVGEVADRVDRWTAQPAWIWEPGSPASAEVANGEVRQDGTPRGDHPVRTAYAYAQMATKLAAEFSRCAALVIGADRPAPGIETKVRSALEAGSVAWWLKADRPAVGLPDATAPPQQRPRVCAEISPVVTERYLELSCQPGL